MILRIYDWRKIIIYAHNEYACLNDAWVSLPRLLVQSAYDYVVELPSNTMKATALASSSDATELSFSIRKLSRRAQMKVSFPLVVLFLHDRVFTLASLINAVFIDFSPS